MSLYRLRFPNYFLPFAFAPALLLGTPMVVVAAEEDDDRIVEELIVTAEKRAESILEVPLTMSAFGAKMIEELGMTGDDDLEQLVPGLQFAYDTEGNGVSMRGIGTQKGVQYNADHAVAFYVDGVYTNDIFGLAPNMFDIERVEVARGPQGTLNGRNSIAGSISYMNKRPTDTWDLEVMTEFTDQFSQRYNVAVGGPITESLAFRVTGGYHEGDGAQKNAGIGDDSDAPDAYSIAPQLRFKTDRADINVRYQLTQDDGASRSSIYFIDRDRSSPTYLVGPWPVANPTYLYDKRNPAVDDCPTEQFRVNGGICKNLDNKVLSNRQSIMDSKTERWSVNADFALTETLSLRYTYGQAVTDTFTSRDGDGTDRTASAEDPFIPADCVANHGLQTCQDEGVFFSDSETASIYDNDESSHELQLFSNFDGPFNFVAGLYQYESVSHWRDSRPNYANEQMYYNAEDRVALIDLNEDGQPDYANCQEFYQSYVLGADDPATPWIDGVSQDPATRTGCEPGSNHLFKGGSSSGAAYDVQAAFINGEYKINDAWRVSGGVRKTKDEKDQRGVSGTSGVAFILGVPISAFGGLQNRADDWSKTIGHVSVEFTPSEQLLYYGRVSTGFRAGGFNQISGGTSAEDIANNVVPATFEGEELVNYEFGAKGWFFDRTLMLMAGVYFQDFDGFQLNETQRIIDSFAASRESPFLEYTANIDGTEIWGTEIEATWYLNDRWRISGFYNFLDSSVGDVQAFFYNRDASAEGTFVHNWIDLETGTPMSAEIPAPRDAKGKRLPQQPKHKGAVTVTYNHPLGDRGSITALSTLSFIGDRYPNIGDIAYQKLYGYERWDARVTWDSADRGWSVTAYVQNILDEIGIQEFAFDYGWLTEPRQIGLQVRWRPNF